MSDFRERIFRLVAAAFVVGCGCLIALAIFCAALAYGLACT